MIIAPDLLRLKLTARVVWVVLPFLLLSASGTRAQLRLAEIFSSNMVIQRDEPIHIWGTGLPRNEVRVTLGEDASSVLVSNDSTWRCVLGPRKATAAPQVMTIASAGESVQFHNILVGDVWLCLGQSNMEWPMRSEEHYSNESTMGHQAMLRFYNPRYAGKGIYGEAFSDSIMRRLKANEFYEGAWQVCDQVSMPQFY